MKKKGTLKFDSDDTEGSDLSYESSFDKKGELLEEEDPTKNLQIFNEQMIRFLLNRPELNDNLNLQQEIDYKTLDYVPPVVEKDNPHQPHHTGGGGQTKSNIPIKIVKEQVVVKQPYKNEMWNAIFKNISNESKRNSTLPSIEAFTQRLNLLRRKVQQSDIIDLLYTEQDTLIKQIQKQQKRKEKLKFKIDKEIEEELKKQSGQVEYNSFRKKRQFTFRMQLEKKKRQEISGKEKEQLQKQQLEQQLEEMLENPNATNSNQPTIIIDKTTSDNILINNSNNNYNNSNNLNSNNNTNINSSNNINYNNNNILVINNNNNPNLGMQQNNNNKSETILSKKGNLQRINSTISNLKNEISNGTSPSGTQPQPVVDKPTGNVWENLFNNQNKNKKNNQNNEENIEKEQTELKSQKAKQLYKEIKKEKLEDEDIKLKIIDFVNQYREEMKQQFKLNPSILHQGQKYYSEESKEFMLLTPNLQLKNELEGQIPPTFFEKRNNLEEGSVYLLTQVNRLLKGNLLKKWKAIQDVKL